MSADPQKFEEDKQHDIVQVKRMLVAFQAMGEGFASSKLSRSELQQLLEKASEAAKEIRWDMNDSRYVRNQMGRFNYKTDKENKRNFLDLGLLENIIWNLEDAGKGRLFLDLLLAQKESLLEEFIVIERTLAFHLHRLGEGDCPEGDLDKSFEPPQCLYNTIHYWLDDAVITRLNSLFIDYIPVSDDAEDWEERYHAARLITIMGESVKLLSRSYKEENLHTPLQALIRLRDKIAHNHRHLISAPVAEFAALFKPFLRGGLEKLKHELLCLHTGMRQRLALFEAAESAAQIAMVKSFFEPLGAKVQKIEKARRIELNADSLIDEIKGDIDAGELKLIRARLLIIKRKKLEICSQQLKNLSDMQANSCPTQSKLEKLETKKDAVVSRIQAFESRLDQLNEKEHRRLSGMRESLEKSNIKIAAERAKPAESIVDQVTSLTDTVVRLRAEIKAMETCSIVVELDRLSKRKKSGSAPLVVPVDRQQGGGASAADEPAPRSASARKFNHLVKRWNEELELLMQIRVKCGHRVVADGPGRVFELEYALAVIGQLFRDMQCTSSEQLARFSNATIDSSRRDTVAARNKDIMHNPFTNQTAQLISCTDNAVIPLTYDAQAILALSDEAFVNQIHSNKMEQGAHLNNLGTHYMRIGKNKEALSHFKQAHDLIFSCDLQKDHGIVGEVTLFEFYDGDVEAMAKVTSSADSIEGRIVMLRISQRGAFARYRVLGNIAAALAEQETESAYKEAILYLERVRYIFNKTTIRELPDFGWQPLSLSIWIDYKVNPRPFDRGESHEELAALSEGDYTIYASLIINISTTQIPVVRRQMLESLNLKRINVVSALFSAHMHLYAMYMSLHVKKTDDLTPEVADIILGHLESAKQLWFAKRGQLIDQSGDAVRKFEQQILDACMKVILPAQSLALHTKNSALLERCLHLCQRFEVNTDFLKSNLRTLYSDPRLWTDSRVLERYKSLLIEQEKSDNLVVKTKALLGFVFYYEAKGHDKDLLRYLILAHECYQLIDDADKYQVPEYGDYDDVLNGFLDRKPRFAKNQVARREGLIPILKKRGRAREAELERKRVDFLCSRLPENRLPGLAGNTKQKALSDSSILCVNPSKLRRGDCCQISGLVRSREYNGLTCRVVKWLPEKGRMKVVLDNPTVGSEQYLSVLLSNLRDLPEAECFVSPYAPKNPTYSVLH